MLKRIIILVLFCFSFGLLELSAQTSSPASPAAEKPKAPPRMTKEERKNAVRSRSNGEIMVGRIKLVDGVRLNMPYYLDSYMVHFYPELNLDDLDKKINELKEKNTKRKRETGMKDIIDEINSFLGRMSGKLKEINPSEGVMRSRIEMGVPLFWLSQTDIDFTSFLMARASDRTGSKNMEDWKKNLQNKLYDMPIKHTRTRPDPYVVLGYNSKTGEFAITNTLGTEMIMWVTPSEMKKYNFILLEAQL